MQIIDRTNPESWPFMLSRKEVKEILGVNHNRVLEIFHRPDFPKITMGKRLLVSKPALLDYLEKQAQQNS